MQITKKKKKLLYFYGIIIISLIIIISIHQIKQVNTYKEISNGFTISTFNSLREYAQSSLEILDHHSELYSIEELRELVNSQSYIVFHIRELNGILSSIDHSLMINHGEFSVLEQVRVASTEEGVEHLVLNEEELREIDHFRNICESIIVEYEKFTTFEDVFLVDEVSTILRNLEQENNAYRFSRVKLR